MECECVCVSFWSLGVSVHLIFFLPSVCICVHDGVLLLLLSLHLLAYAQNQCCKPVKLQKERETVLGGFGGVSPRTTVAHYESPNKARRSPMKLL